MTSIPTFSRPAGRRAATANPTAGSGRERWVLPIAIIAAIVLGLAGWMLLVSPVRSTTSAVSGQAATVDTQVDTLRAQLAKLKADQANLPTYQAELKAAQAALPTTAGLPAFLRSLQGLGTATGTTVTGLNATAPDGTTVAAGNGAAGVGNVYKLPITITVSGTPGGLNLFLAGLQNVQPRAVLVTSFNMTDGQAGATTITIGMTAFVAPTAGSSANGG